MWRYWCPGCPGSPQVDLLSLHGWLGGGEGEAYNVTHTINTLYVHNMHVMSTVANTKLVNTTQLLLSETSAAHKLLNPPPFQPVKHRVLRTTHNPYKKGYKQINWFVLYPFFQLKKALLGPKRFAKWSCLPRVLCCQELTNTYIETW